MKKQLLYLFLFLPFFAFAQTSNDKIVRGFPITDYIVDVNDSVKIVQVPLEQTGIIIEKQVGVLKSRYGGEKRPEVIGTGRCNLIKGNFYYYAINFKESGVLPKKGDLLYIVAEKPSVYVDRLVNFAAHSITLNDVDGHPFYDRTKIFISWSEKDEKAAVDSMLMDISTSADYLLKNKPSSNTEIKSGPNQGKLILNMLRETTKKELYTFFDYMNSHSRMYAGRDLKVFESYATWLSVGSPTP